MRERAYGDHKPPLPSPPRSYSSLPLHEVTWHMSLYSPHPTPPLPYLHSLFRFLSLVLSFVLSTKHFYLQFRSNLPLFLVLLLLYSFPLIFILSPYISFIFRHGRHNRSTNCLIPAVDFPANREEENRDNSFE